ncbi:tyrosine recombinase XerC [Clostridium ragsdalei P11]|uniref:Tyrosine recombinase XerC n=1 Tax=Clostridium ragsdalei P11 TaxID=1353534 RepID=A0A1A6AVR4_9CLOT|nr:tyrosine-type recombinase/integrase [Clostridium ragsdalei]OBR94137.1 tyrosine recombinase XerC [Clostridium ragsdalei P11]
MQNEIFRSGFSKQLSEFLNFKREFGHPYKNGAYYLMDFDRFCSDKYPNAEILNSDIAMEWSCIRQVENSNGFISRITPLRQFGKYLVQKGINAFILPDGLHGNSMPKIPYVFSDASLQQFFTVVDHMSPYYQSAVRHLVAPVMFRYMYCCGLRPREARCLHKEDVNLKTGRIFIRESKGHKERFIIIPQELIRLTVIYLKEISLFFPESTALFIDRKGRFMTYDTQKYLFSHCRELADIKAAGSKEVNLYSFRHTFATFRIYKWIKEGKDIDTLLPCLSSYMGHEKIENTLYYLHLVPEAFTNMTGINLKQFNYLIPEVSLDD